MKEITNTKCVTPEGYEFMVYRDIETDSVYVFVDGLLNKVTIEELEEHVKEKIRLGEKCIKNKINFKYFK